MDNETLKDIIINESKHLTIDQHREILKMVRGSHMHAVKEMNDGTRILLDKLPANLIFNIYEYIKRVLQL